MQAVKCASMPCRNLVQVEGAYCAYCRNILAVFGDTEGMYDHEFGDIDSSETNMPFEGSVTCLYIPDTGDILHQRFHDTDYCDLCGKEWHVDDLETGHGDLILCPVCRLPDAVSHTGRHILKWGLTFAALLMALAAIATALKGH